MQNSSAVEKLILVISENGGLFNLIANERNLGIDEIAITGEKNADFGKRR